MAPKRPLEDEVAGPPEAKKPKKGFRVGPENLPDGPWRRKIDKVKKGLIEKAKLKKQYAKIKAAEEHAAAKPTSGEQDADGGAPADAPEAQIHPERQAMLDEEEPEAHPEPDKGPAARPRRPRGPKPRRPDYFEKAKSKAERRKAEAEERKKELQRRNEERQRRIEERDRFRKAMKKARTPGRDGQRRLGRESGLLLDKAKRIMGEGK